MDMTKAKGLLRKANRKGMLALDAATYRRAVEAVATVLRPRFESGELRPWSAVDGDMLTKNQAERRAGKRVAKWVPPFWQLEKECSRLFIRNPYLAVLVVEHASTSARSHDPFKWDEENTGSTLRACAETAMAWDVIGLVNRRGWVRA